MENALHTLRERLADANALGSALAIMDWDQQTYMPKGGADARSEHMGILSRMHHETLVADETRAALDAAVAENEDDVALLRVVRRELDLKTKIPTALVEEKARLSASAHEAWVEARANNTFASFAPLLERMFEIAREEAEHLGYEADIYDALLDQYEEGATAAEVRTMFDAVRGPQVELIRRIGEQPATDDSVLYGDWDIPSQKRFTESILKKMGYDFNRGRQDIAPHPFCTGWSIGDIRITTRYKDYLGSSIFGSLHEMGHAVYEQGQRPEWDLTPLAGGVSLGLHESQSRLWENIVGRSLPFWKWAFPELSAEFPAISHLGPEGFYKAINRVQPSFIRVEADELTYNLHVMVRFEIESSILKGTLAVADMPEAWNALYESYLGVHPPTDSLGCLQDVHWSMGSIGYFPTYSMGNLLSYQIWRKLQSEIGDTDALIEAGEFAPILGWLQENIYQAGCKYPPKELVQRVTGKPMDPTDYIDGLNAKYSDIYGL